MAKKKTKKTNKTKRTTRSTLDARNERLGKTDAPKPRKSRKPKSVVTTEPATETIMRVEAELLDSGWKHDITTDDFVFHTDTKNTCCGGCNPNAPWWRKADAKMDQFKNWFGNKVEKAMHWAFDHPLAFTISLMSFFLGVTILVLLSSRK